MDKGRNTISNYETGKILEMNLYLQFALRYFKGGKKSSFSSNAISLAVFGLAIGVFLLILTMSIIKGFEEKIYLSSPIKKVIRTGDGVELFFVKNDKKLKLQLPHMGWNDVKSVNKSKLFDGMHDEARFYFLHSYYYQVKNKEHSIGHTSYNNTFCSAIQKDNIYGIQFHPEKSHKQGENILQNFAEL